MIEELTGGRTAAKGEVHLDPDIEAHTTERPNGFLPGFGQSGGAQTHLWNQGVRKGPAEQDADLFLFFGLYRPVANNGTSWCYARKRELHMLFGWLQVGTVLTLSSDKPPKQLERHPHVLRSFIVRNELGARREDNNTLYVARERLSFAPDISGAGSFGPIDVEDFDDPRRLTYRDNSCSLWRLPTFFYTLSNMGHQEDPRDGWWYPQRRGPGQEFVLNTDGCESEAQAWLLKVFKHAERVRAANAC
jgi:hypothetical protein